MLRSMDTKEMVVFPKVCTIEKHENDINSLDVYGDKMASGSSDKTVRLFEITPIDPISVVEVPGSPMLGHELGVTCVRFRSPLMLLSCSIDGCVIVWDIWIEPKILNKISQFGNGSLRAVSTCLFSDKFAASGDGGVTLWKGLSYGKIEYYKCLSAFEDVVNTISFTSDGKKLVSGSSDGTLHLWDAEFSHNAPLTVEYCAHELGVLTSDIEAVKGFKEVENYILATGGRDDLVKIWKITVNHTYSFSLEITCNAHRRSVNAVKFSSLHSVLISVGDDQRVIIWNPKTGALLHSFDPLHSRPAVLTCTVAHDIIFTGSSDKTIHGFKIDQTEIWPVSPEPEIKPQAFLHWSTVDVGKWIKSIGVGQYVELFSNYKVNGFLLNHMDMNFLCNVLHIDVPEDRVKILKAVQALKSSGERPHEEDEDSSSFAEFFCPITKEIMEEPVVASDGFSYEKSALKQWFDDGHSRSPVTNAELQNLEFYPNFCLMSLIKKFNS